MIKRYLDFIKEDNEFHSLGEWIESLIDDEYVRNIVSRYTKDSDPSIDLSNAINILDEKTQQERIAICNACPELNHTLRQCKVCLCFVDAKTKLKSSYCPEKKWHPVFDENI